MATTSADPRALTDSNLDGPSLAHAFQATATAYADDPVLKLPDGTVTHTWGQYAAQVREVAAGLAALGVKRGDCVGLMLTNRAEFYVVDAAAIHLGATPFSIYNTNPADQLLPLYDNSGCKVVVTEQAFLPVVMGAREQRPHVEHVVAVDGDGGTMTLDDLKAGGADGAFDFDATWQGVNREDVLTLVYTSGTTGNPKGVQHTHGTILVGLKSLDEHAPVTPSGRVVSYLPMAHIAERFISYYAAMINGHTITCVANPKDLAAALGGTRPTRLFGVPRIYEKLQAAVMGMAAADPEGPLAKAIEAGLERVRNQGGSAAAVTDLPEEHAKVLAGVRAKLGLDQAEWCGIAAAPSPLTTLEFYPAIGITLIHFWGMSECLFACTNPASGGKLGYVGQGAPGVQIKVADDGEILVKGPNVMVGYRGEPDKTAEAIDPDGWLYSGDIAETDDEGNLKVVDRKKELIINSAGKNMAPSKIEMAVKENCDLIAQVVAIGDTRQYVTALVVLDEEAALAWAKANDVAQDVGAVSAHPAIQEQVATAVAKGNEKLARVEQIKSHTVLDVAWTPGGDEVTPTMKLKRRIINDKYSSVIDGLYS